VYSGWRAFEMEAEHEPVANPVYLQAKPFQIVSVGRPHWVKGYPYALDACSILKAQGFDFHFTIVGGSGDIELVYQVCDLNLSEQVTLLNQLPYSQVQELILQSDLLLLSSVKEGIANVVLEAMALGTLVLSTDCGGMDEVIHDSETGFLVPIRDSQAMVAKIIEIADLTEAECLMILERARLKILEQHTEEQMVRGMLGIYNSLYFR
ncbi:glycosyltransferase family 4 protein, partial [Bizionia echini]|uniref:glycosyltransferase family 4 protein n=1 Tax=Bizionia echini TaxID=649333 RepID=UPI0030DA4D4A